MSRMESTRGTCTINFTNKHDKDRAFYELVHAKAEFSGVDKNTIVIQKKDCSLLESKNIKYHRVK